KKGKFYFLAFLGALVLSVATRNIHAQAPWWQHHYKNSESPDTYFLALERAPQAGWFAVGATGKADDVRPWLSRIDYQGTLLWDTVYGEEDDDAYFNCLLPAGDVWVA